MRTWATGKRPGLTIKVAFGRGRTLCRGFFLVLLLFFLSSLLLRRLRSLSFVDAYEQRLTDSVHRAMSLVKWIITSFAPIFIVTSPVTSYGDQIWAMNKKRTSAGFSLDIPLIMLVASITK